MARKTRKKAPPRMQRQLDGVRPIIEDPTLPRMGEGDPVPRRIGRALLFMPENPERDRGTRNRMTPFRRIKSQTEKRVPTRGYPDQEPPKPPRRTQPAGGASGKAKEGYVRLRVLVEDGALSVAGAKFVEGPLAEANALHPGLAYEVTLGSRSIAAGGVADAGVWRSFPDPLGRPGLQGHHIAEVPSYEIAVRIPVQKLSISALPKAQITLYRWRGTGPAMALAGTPLKAQLKGPVETVATLKGIRMSQLSKEAQTELRRALR
jgi:hypothetical protein